MAGQTQIGSIHVDASIGTAEYVAGSRKLKAETASLERDIKGRFAGIGATVKGGIAGLVGALSVGAFIQLGRAALDYAGSIGEVSQQLGVTTRDLQTFRFAATQLGVTQAELEKGLEILTKTLGRVAVGAERPAKALEAIGLNAQAIARMDTGDAFRAIADALSQVEDRAQRAAIETELFGRSGAKLDTMLSGGSGALNELAAAADKLGIVLSDEQIQNADVTADKLDALKTVLMAKVAGVVADNADAINSYADSLANLIDSVIQVIGWLQKLRDALNSLPSLNLRNRIFGAPNQLTNSVTVKLPPASKPAAPREVGNFLAGGGGGGRRRATRTPRAPRDDTARDLFRFEQDELRAQMDILRAKQQLSQDYVERTTLGVQILDLERQGYQNDLAFQVKEKDLTQVQADKLQLLYDQKDQLERQKLLDDEQARRREDVARLDAVTLDIQRDALEAQLQLADTAAEERDIRLRLLDLAYRQERARLETIMADEQSSEAAKEEARRRLAGLNSTYSADRQGVLNSTAGPLESYYNSLPMTAEKMNEALENVAVNGLKSLEDGLMSVIDGTESVGEAFRKMAQSILSDLIRLSIQKMIIGPLANALFGGMGGGVGGVGLSPYINGNSPTSILPTFASGGGFDIRGRPGIDKNVMALNGIPIANVSYGERVSISNDNAPMRGNSSFSAPITIHVNGNVDRRTADQLASTIRRRVASVAAKGME